MKSLQAIFRQSRKLSRRSENKQLPLLKMLNEHVYEFYSPTDVTSVNLEIVFFHGLEPGAFEMAYVETWTSFEDSTATCWPQTLLAKDFPRARILSVSYDSSIKRGRGQGILDLYLTAENLLQDLIDGAKVAANPGLPVILVGKDLGGLVIKAICMKARTHNRFDTFMNNLQGVFYYRTPHLGIEKLPTAFTGALAERLALFHTEIARLGSEFSNYRKLKWATGAIISLQESDKVPELVISEGSQRYDVDEYYTANKGIDTVCKRQAKTSSTFKFLTGFISRIERGKLQPQSSSDGGRTEDVESCFGQEYGLSIHASMMFVLEKLDQDAKQLLYQISLFDGPFIPESLLRLFLRFTIPKEEKMNIFRFKSSLVAKGLVQIEINKFGRHIKIGMQVLRVHSLCQHFILTTKEKEIYRITDFLDNNTVQKLDRCDIDLATALCAIYGATYVKQRALEKMGWSVEHCRGLASALQPFLSLMLGEGGNDSHISQAATVVFRKLLIDGSLDDHNIEILLCKQECIAATCHLLDDLIFTDKEIHPSNNGGEPRVSFNVATMPSTLNRLVTLLSMGNRITCANVVSAIRAFAILPQNRVPIVQFPLCLDRLVALLAQDVETSLQENVASCFTWLVNCDVTVDMLATPFLLERVILLLAKDGGRRCESAATVITFLANAPENRVPIVEFPSCLERLVALLARDVEQGIQLQVAIALSHLLQAPKNRVTIAQFPSCLDRLVALLAQDVETSLQQNVVSCFTWLADSDVRVDMLATPFLFERVVSLLSKDMVDVCHTAVAIINHLAKAPQNRVAIVRFRSCLERLVALLARDVEQRIQLQVAIALTRLAEAPENRVTIVQFPSCLDRLVALLAQDVETSLQRNVATCFTWLADCDVTLDMLATRFLLERMVSLLSKNMGDVCESAVITIRCLAKAPDNRVLIVEFPSCLERLVALLAQDVEQGIQEKVRDLMVLLDCDVQAIRNSAIEDVKKGNIAAPP